MSADPERDAVQLSFEGFEGVQHEEVMVDYGPVGDLPDKRLTASKPRYVLASSGQEYIIKGPSITPSDPFVGVNEYLSVQLARYLGLPVLPFSLVNYQDQLCFGSAWMNKDEYYPKMSPEIFQKSANREIVYKLIPFDCWVANEDRHDENLLARRHVNRQSGEEVVTLLLSDHGYCLMRPGITPATLKSRLSFTAGQCIRLQYLSDAVISKELLDMGVSAIENLSEELIQLAIRHIPDQWLAQQDREQMFEYLLDRRKSLRALLNAERDRFPALKGETL